VLFLSSKEIKVSANPPAPTSASTLVITPDVVSTVENLLIIALSAAFPPAAPIIMASGAAIKALTPYVILAIQGHQFTMAELKDMQLELNKFGPSFPNAPGYANAFAGGAAPAPGTSPSAAAPMSATVTLKSGVAVTLSAADANALIGLLTGLLNKAPAAP
jgi:hypothetical protein